MGQCGWGKSSLLARLAFMTSESSFGMAFDETGDVGAPFLGRREVCGLLLFVYRGELAGQGQSIASDVSRGLQSGTQSQEGTPLDPLECRCPWYEFMAYCIHTIACEA